MNFRYLVLLVLIATSGVSVVGVAGSGHGHGENIHESTPGEHAHSEPEKGPNGGRLLEHDEVSVEITIFETGIDPEMRVYVYKNNELVAPKNVNLNITLDRLGGVHDVLSFSAENDYLVSEQIIVEPHSYEVNVEVTVDSKVSDWHFTSFEGRTEISPRLQALSGIGTEVAGTQTLNFIDSLYGVIAAPEDQIFRVFAPYASLVSQVHVQVGDYVEKGQKILTLRNISTQQSYVISSPSSGEITKRMVNAGDRASDNVLLEVSDLSTVWVEMSAFPENIEHLSIGQKVVVNNLHDAEDGIGAISYVAPQMTGGHIARARAIISNASGEWRPGMHIKAQVQIEQRDTALAVRSSALQSFRGNPVVFAKFENIFEVRMLELGDSDGQWVEVLGGLAPGTEYVVANSFLIKADVLKDGASHDH